MKSGSFDLRPYLADKTEVNTRKGFTSTLPSFTGHFKVFLSKLKVHIFAFILGHFWDMSEMAFSLFRLSIFCLREKLFGRILTQFVSFDVTFLNTLVDTHLNHWNLVNHIPHEIMIFKKLEFWLFILIFVPYQK